ncbi:transposase [Sphingomonas xinjiangensis]|uniref:Transposase n=1 Tax=Sphingomonas xinjiangensis TaxID=643568 RepID=A0A840YSQ3_9SPHN|nr:transposase [Sphingomonas xinjiangensis]
MYEQVHLNFAYGWVLRVRAHHSTFSKNRHGWFRDSDLLRQLSKMTVARRIAEGPVAGEALRSMPA